MKSLLLILLVSLVSLVQSKEEDLERVSQSLETLYSIERSGIKYYRKGKYKKAYEKLYKSATWGLKDSQYYLGLMYLNGFHIDKNNIIGLALIGVSNEAEIKQRIKTYQLLYKALSPKEQLLVDEKLKEYVFKFGLKAKGLRCTKSADLGSRKQVVDCTSIKSDGGIIYSIE